jgi:hypothetical protein
MAELTHWTRSSGKFSVWLGPRRQRRPMPPGWTPANNSGDQLDRMRDQAEETERRTDALIDSLQGRKTAIRELAQETKTEAEEMLRTYLADEEEALDGVEFLTMAEAGELGHWEIVQTMSKTVGEDEVTQLADWAVEIQRGHFDGVRESSLKLAEDEARGA